MNHILIAAEECKGCGLCVELCPKKCIAFSANINHLGYQYAEFKSDECTACGICFNVCPEPGAITVFLEEKQPKNE